MTFVKGYKIDRGKVAETFEVADRLDPEVDELICTIVHELFRGAYKYIATAKERAILPGQEDGHIALIIVLEVDDNEMVLREKEIDVHESIRKAEPHVLVGPDIWELA